MRSLLLLLAALLIAPAALAQTRANEEARPSPNASVSQTIGTTVVTVTYGRPSVKGRTVFGNLAPYGEVWRTGANEASTITFSDDVMVEGKPVPAGTYSLFTVPGEDEWIVIFNSVPTQWGAFRYDREQDAMRVEVAPAMADASQEQFLVSFDGVTDSTGTMTLAWDRVRVPVEIRAVTAAPVQAPMGDM